MSNIANRLHEVIKRAFSHLIGIILPGGCCSSTSIQPQTKVAFAEQLKQNVKLKKSDLMSLIQLYVALVC